jgi:hypothetical protein
MRPTQTPSSHLSQDILSLFLVVTGQANHDEPFVSLLKRHYPGFYGTDEIMFTLMRSTQNPSCLSSKDILSMALVVTGQVIILP